MQCTILDDYQNVSLSMGEWSVLQGKVSVKVINEYIANREDLISKIIDSEIVVIMRERTVFDAALLAQLPKLKLLVTSGMRNAAIDLEAATARGIIVSGTNNFSEPPVELTWALIHALTRHIVQENENIKQNRWQTTLGIDLKGKQLGLLGYGKTGKQVASVAKAFGMTVSAWSQNLTQESVANDNVNLAPSKEALLKTSDIISIHLVHSPRTHHLLGLPELQLMKKSAYLINTSRAGIVNQDALLTALQNNTIAGAAADVFSTEPLPINHPFRHLSNFLATPHIGYVTERNYHAYYGEAVENIQAYLSGNPVRVLNTFK